MNPSRGARYASCALALALAACSDAQPRARAQVIGTLEDAVGGPHAIGRAGDFLLENDQIRLVIADTGVYNDPNKVSTYGRVNTTYGGSLVDADLQRVGGARGNGNDQLAELLPGLLFTVINPTDVSVTKRGDDGGPAEVTVTGTGGDLLQMVALLNTGVVFPSNLELKNIYRLYPGKRYVEIETVITNKAPGGGQHPFPYLNPQELDNLLGQNVPDIANIPLSVPIGQLPLLGGEQDLFAPGVAGFNVKYAIEDSYKIAGGFPGFPGLVVDFLASRGEGVSYGLTVPQSTANYVNAYPQSYPMQERSPYSMLLPFTFAGVAGVFMARPPDVLAPQQTFSFTSYFVVGDGDVASVADVIYELRGTPTGSFGGRVIDAQTSAPVVNANVLILDGQNRPVNHAFTDADGAFLAHLPEGNYNYRVLKDDRLTTEGRSFTIEAGKKTGVQIEMKPPATLVVSALDEQGRHAPMRIQLIGTFDNANIGKDPRDHLYSFAMGERRRPTSFDNRAQFIEGAWWTKDGRVEAQVRPGTYELVITRGPEYEITRKQVTLREGAFTEAQVVLERAYSSPGWIHGDFHIHAAPSTDSGLPIEERVISCAAEGLDVAVATDHNFITDYAPAIAAAGLEPWLLGLPGIELTTFEMGHFNGYPLQVDPGSTRGGEFTWANQPPQKLFDQLRNLGVDPANTIVQVNHPRQQVLGYFASFFFDPATAEPYTPAGILGVFAPYGDEFQADKVSYDFDAVELLTGLRTEDIHNFRAPDPLPPGPHADPQPVPGEIVIDADGRPRFPGTVETWFSLLDHGHTATGMGTSDSHHLIGDEPGYARTLLYVGPDKDTPGGFSRDDVVNAIHAHHAITTNAPFIEMTTDKGGIVGDTITASGSVEVRVRVRSPSWAKVDHLVLYTNGGTVVAEQAIPADKATDYETTVRLNLPRDSWVVAEVTGASNMFPVSNPTEFPPLDATVIISALSAGIDLSALPIASKLQPARIHPSTPYAITNPIWIDTDGGGWNPPKPPLRRVAPSSAPRPDVRTQFDALPAWSPSR
ncbi:MAG: CehA/McbA family metallohydrolase [Kofleriaceae bacterium]|nr:CehA/McbA family metallohydrolase [Kofleriaceae bacterium]